MQNTKFKTMVNYINENGFDTFVIHSGFLWLNLTDRQAEIIKGLAIEKGYTPDNNGAVHVDCWIIK